MSGDSKSFETDQENITPLSNERILFVMVFVVIFGTCLGFAFISIKFGFGFLLGGILSFINYYWLKATLRDIFQKVVGGNAPPFWGVRFVFRYLLIGAILVFIFMTGILPITAIVFGLTSFAFAVLIEAFIYIFSHIFNREEV